MCQRQRGRDATARRVVPCTMFPNVDGPVCVLFREKGDDRGLSFGDAFSLQTPNGVFN